VCLTSLFACDLFCALSCGLDYISNANPACSCVYICKFQFRPIHPPPSRRLSELHWYLRLDRRQRHKRDAQVNTSQREQYGGTVHLFIGTRRSLCEITFMTQIIMGRSVFSSLSRCNPSSQEASLCRSSLGGSFGVASVSIFQRCFLLTGPSAMKQTPNTPNLCSIIYFNNIIPCPLGCCIRWSGIPRATSINKSCSYATTAAATVLWS
jgi:hypothetical protein